MRRGDSLLPPWVPAAVSSRVQVVSALLRRSWRGWRAVPAGDEEAKLAQWQ